MPKWTIGFCVRGMYDVTVEAETEDEAVAAAWKQFGKDTPQAEWDVDEHQIEEHCVCGDTDCEWRDCEVTDV